MALTEYKRHEIKVVNNRTGTLLIITKQQYIKLVDKNVQGTAECQLLYAIVSCNSLPSNSLRLRKEAQVYFLSSFPTCASDLQMTFGQSCSRSIKIDFCGGDRLL